MAPQRGSATLRGLMPCYGCTFQPLENSLFMLLHSLLPTESLREFTVFKASTPQTVWANAQLSAGKDLLDHAYYLPLPGDSITVNEHETKVMLAERYGGKGLAYNGGGVRCGLDQNIQIKGIGKNCLAGNNTDFFHSYGGASLNEGIVEAIWGELFQQALPYGAARCYGLLTTGTRVPLLKPKAGQDPTTARALIIRQACLRIAHFMRAIYFRPQGEMLAAESDTQRTRAAILHIGTAFKTIYGDAPNDPLDVDYLNRCLSEMLRRKACQIAAARAKRIMHGSLIASNTSMDGRWLDFGTVSTLPDYGQFFISPSMPDFLNEELSIRGTLFDLRFYLGKYLPKGIGDRLSSAEQLWQDFETTLATRLKIEFLKLTGIPEQQLENTPTAIQDAVYGHLQRIMRSSNGIRFTLLHHDPETRPQLPEKLGRFQLNAVLKQAALCASQDELEQTLQALLPDTALRQSFIQSYWALMQAQTHTHDAARWFITFNALRLNTTSIEFQRPNLYAAIEELLIEGGDVSAFIETHIHLGQTLFAEPVHQEITLDGWSNSALSLSLHQGFRINQRECSLQEALSTLHNHILTPAQKIRIMNHA